MIDYQDGKVIYDNSFDWKNDISYYSYHQDILQIAYGENCIIDVGNYDNTRGGSHFVIMVIDFSPYQEEDNKFEAWNQPFASIPCQDKDDMLQQLQRAINIYPKILAIPQRRIHPDLEACCRSGNHLSSVDNDGYCNLCGHQDQCDRKSGISS